MNHDCKHCPFNSRVINSINDDSLEKLNSNHITVSFNKGNTIIKQGTFSTNVAFLRTGLVKVHITGPYHEQIVKIKKAPTFLGLPTTFGNKINQYSVTAITDAEVCFIDVEIFKDLLKNNDKFAFEIILELCQYELESFRKCASRTQKQSRGNIAGVLLDFSDLIFESEDFLCPITQSEIGDLVDTTRESVSRILTEFDKEKIISVKGKNIQILNKNSLERISKKG
ncbi:MAG: Transcriptional Regulator Crp/Fnr Family [Bacteroidetes bacterium]|nr:Transcriptional Regulator Crp/Fnr Family [Bacteroidota bacterium]